MRWDVCLAARNAADRAKPKGSPFGNVPARMAARVSAASSNTALADASRRLLCFPEISLISAGIFDTRPPGRSQILSDSFVPGIGARQTRLHGDSVTKDGLATLVMLRACEECGKTQPDGSRRRIMERTDVAGRIVSVNVSETKGVRKTPVGAAEIIARHGIAHDAHAGNGHRQISLLARESIDRMIEMGLAVGPGDF